MLTLYQAEWCPFSSAVRERLTELGLDFVARQVEPQREQRAALREATGADEIPALVTGEGEAFSGTDAVFGYLAGRTGPHAAAHRERYGEHRPERQDETTAEVLAQQAPL